MALIREILGVISNRGPRPCEEDAFRYFLGLEEKRSRRSGRAFFLLRVDLTDRMSLKARSKLAGAIARNLRETDIVGWYQSSRVVGAVITQSSKSADRADAPGVIGERISNLLHGLSAGVKSMHIEVRETSFDPTRMGIGVWP